MATRAALRAEVRELVGKGLYDRCFEDGWANEGLTFACDQAARILGLTYIETDPPLTFATVQAGVPADAMILLNARTLPSGDIMGRTLRKTTRTIEDQVRPGWRDRTGEPTVWMEETGSMIRLNGIPASEAVVLGYMQRPVEMTEDADTPDPRIPEALHPHLKHAAAAYLRQLSGPGKDLEQANDHFKTFGILIGAGPLKLSETEVDR